MNPGDFILLFLSLVFAALNLFAHGWSASVQHCLPREEGAGNFGCSGSGIEAGFSTRIQGSSQARNTWQSWLGWPLATFTALIWADIALRSLHAAIEVTHSRTT